MESTGPPFSSHSEKIACFLLCLPAEGAHYRPLPLLFPFPNQSYLLFHLFLGTVPWCRFYFYFSATVDIQYDLVLLSGVQHSVMYITKWSPHISSTHLAPCIVTSILVTYYLRFLIL